MFATDEDFVDEQARREQAKGLILALLHKHGRLPQGVSLDPADLAAMTQALCFAIHKQLASSRSQIVAIQLEDMMMINKPVNIPGTSHEYPNWRRKLDRSSQELFAQSDIQQFCRDITGLRQL
jgi:4-alpha-glucanotransferase